MYANVIFPLRLKSFTYRSPSSAPHNLIGRIVKAPLGSKELYGVVSEVKDSLAAATGISDGESIAPPSRIKEIMSIYGHFGSPSTPALLKWLSDYYLLPPGVALAGCFFKEAAASIQRQDIIIKIKRTDVPVKEYFEPLKISESERHNISLITGAMQQGTFGSYLLHSPSLFYENGFLRGVFEEASSFISGAIILVPEINQIEKISSVLKTIFGERVCIIHSRQGRKKRMETVRGILSGCSDIVVGTRSAILAPLKDISLIAVLSEHSPSYKGEEGLRYNGRDVAVMRGFLEKIPVLLSSICPSLESVYNTSRGKYNYLKVSEAPLWLPEGQFSLFSPEKRPNIEIVDIRDAEKTGVSISKRVQSTAKKYLLRKENLLFVANQKGYSLIICRDCGYIFSCPACRVTLVFYKTEGLLRCRLCGQEKKAPNSCKICGSIDLKPFGSGMERIKEDAVKFLKMDIIPLEKNKQWLNSDNHTAQFVMGHGQQIRELRENSFNAAIFFDIDKHLAEHNYRANERAFQDVIQVSQFVRPGGSIFLQTRHPGNKTLNFIQNYDFRGFYESELSLRKETDFPPFSRLILINIYAKQGINSLKGKVEGIFTERLVKGIEILGPIEIPSTVKSYDYCLQVLLRAKDRKTLNQFAAPIVERLTTLKTVKVSIDADPIRL